MSGNDALKAKQQAVLALSRMQARLDAAERQERLRREPIAIVGLGCRFPGAADPAAFWRLLRDGVEAVTDVPAERWDTDAYYHPTPGTPGRMYTRRAGLLAEVDRFDAQFFGISPREAVSMDPQQRLLLEVAWEALEDAGIAPDRLAGSATGVFVGICNNDYVKLDGGADAPAAIDAYSGTGSAFSVAAGRISYTLGLQGPSMAVDTACSSSLVALHLACQSLRSGESRLALAGGVNLVLSPLSMVTLCSLGMLSPEGRCKTFDAGADGFARGEGCGIVVLKRLSDAVAGGDRILAVVRGSAVNQDGRSSGLTAPNGPAQEAVLRAALADARAEPAEISYLEAHGTGTQLGDPIEVGALRAVFAAAREPERPLTMGSVKTNIGHLESAAGIAGLIKVVLALRHGEIPPHLHLRRLNPHLDLGRALTVVTARSPWPAGRRLAGISSFGFSGTNAHVIVEEAPAAAAPPAAGDKPLQDRPVHLLLLSARTRGALAELAARYAARLDGVAAARQTLALGAAGDTAGAAPPAGSAGPGTEGEEKWSDICHSANTGRAQFAHRLAVTAPDAAAARAALADFAAGRTSTLLQSGEVEDGEPPRIAFLFTGQGSQHPGMGRGLFAAQPVFRDTLERCDAVLRRLRPERALLDVLYGGSGEAGAGSLLDSTLWAQPALFALEAALARTLLTWGVAATAVLGHSIGEYAAACVAGACSLEEGLELVAERARLMASLPADGAMAAVFAGEEQVTTALGRQPGGAGRISIAALNGPEDTVLAGERRALEAALDALTAAGIRSRTLPVALAFHSPQVEPLLGPLAAAAARVSFAPPRLGLVSNLTGDFVRGDEMAQPDYWVRHARQPVRFADGVRALRRRGYDVLIEVGPRPSLIALGRRSLAGDAGGLWLPTLRPGRDDCTVLAHTLAQLHLRGLRIDGEAWDRGHPRRRVALPTYPFQRQRYWREAAAAPATETATTPTAARSQGARPGPPAEIYELAWRDGGPAAPAASGGADVPAGSAATSAPAENAGPSGNWLIFADEKSTALGERLARRIRAEGRMARLVTGDDPVILEHALSGHTWRGIACLCRAGPDATASVEPATAAVEPEAPPQAALGACTRVLRLIQAVARHRGPGPCRPAIHLVTRGAVAVSAGEAVSPAAAALWGLGRTAALEHPEIWGGLLDLAPDLPVTANGPGASQGSAQAATPGEPPVAGTGAPERAREAQEQAGEAQGMDAEEEALLAEVTRPRHPQDRAPEVALRGGRRRLAHLALRQWPAVAQPAAPPTFTARPDGTYLVTGGMGALGLRLARWLAEAGAGRLLLVSRRGEAGLDAAGRAAVATLAATGVRVEVAAADVASPAEVARVVAEAGSGLRGVFHAAGVLDDGALLNQSPSRWAQVMAPKAAGAWNLHRLTAGLPLDAFVLCSSAAGLLGSPGQGSYAAANAFLDGLAQLRRAGGQPALSVAWGLWEGPGMGTAVASAVARDGARLTPDQGLAALAELLREPAGAAQAAVLPAGWMEQLAARSGRTERDAAAALGARLRQALPGERPAVVRALVEAEVRAILRLDAATPIRARQAFFDLGLDSLMAMELRRRLQDAVGAAHPLPQTLVFDHPTLDGLAAVLQREMLAEDAAGATTARRGPPADAADAAAQAESEPIAIVGMACRFPGADSPEAFWQLLRTGGEAISDVPADRWDADAYYDPDPDAPGKMITRRGGFLSGIDLFDAPLFGISRREAVSMDPQQRLLLEVGWTALESAGLAPDGLAGSRTGVFVGISGNDYARRLSAAGAGRIDAYAGTGSVLSAAAGRLSFTWGLVGPSLAVDTACSSSLVALHLACRSLMAGECDLALAAGVNVILAPEVNVNLSRARMLAADGRCKTFDAAADGYVRGEGCGVLVLRRLSRATAAGDRIRALIRGSAVNQDGRSIGLTAPNGPAQEAVLREALGRAGVAPASVGYVEAHGTGTPLGDPIEMRALAAVFTAGRSTDRPLFVGSVKTNIGHLEAAAGMAGLIKAVLALEEGEVPPHLHLRQLNPRIDLTGVPLRVPVATTPWPLPEGPRRAGVSSFGFIGTNAHVVLEEAPPPARVAAAPGVVAATPPEAAGGAASYTAAHDRASPYTGILDGAAPYTAPLDRAAPDRAAANSPDRDRHLLCLSARTPGALRALAGAYRRQLAAGGAALPDIAFSAHLGRSLLPHRLALTAATSAEAAARLAAFEDGRTAPGLVLGRAPEEPPKVAFLFGGAAAPWDGLATALGRCRTEPLFRQEIGACSEALVRAMAAAGGDGAAGGSVLAEVLAAIDHGDGAVMAAGAAGSAGAAGTAGAAAEMAVPIATIATIAEGVDQNPAARTALGLLHLAVQHALAALWRSWGIAPAVVLGQGMGSLAAACAAGILRIDEALLLAATGCRDESCAGISFGAPQIPFLSGVLGRATAAGESLDRGGWLPRPGAADRCDDALDALRGHECRAVIEMGADGDLMEHTRRRLGQDGSLMLASIRPANDSDETLLDSLAALYTAGAAIDWQGFDHGRARRRVPVPTYPFDRRRYWIEEAAPAPAPSAPPQPAAVQAAGIQANEPEPRQGLTEQLYELRWEPVPDGQTAEPPPPGPWLLFGAGPDGPAARAAAALREKGERCHVVLPGDAEPGAAVQALPPPAEDETLKVVFAWGEDPGAPDPDLVALEAAQAHLCGALLQVVQGLAARNARLWIVTRGAQSAGQVAVPAQNQSRNAALGEERDAAQNQESHLPTDQTPETVSSRTEHEIPARTENQARIAAAKEAAAVQDLPPAVAGDHEPGSAWVLDTAGSNAPSPGSGLALPALHAAPLWGMARVVALEHAALRPVCLDLDPEATEEKAARTLAALLGGAGAGGTEGQLLCRSGRFLGPQLVRVAAPEPGARPVPRTRTSWLITGGLGALGMRVAERLVALGTGSLVLAGRGAPGPRQEERIAALERGGARVAVRRCDVSRPEEAAALLDWMAAELPPLAGIVHAAGVLDDGILLRQDARRFARVMAPKVAGAWNLDRLTRGLHLEHFVCFSSAASLLGAAGQGNYAAANAFLDALAHHRRERGLAALTIGWPAWAEEGMAAVTERPARGGVERRLHAISTSAGLDLFERLLGARSPLPAHVGVLPGLAAAAPAAASAGAAAALPPRPGESGGDGSGAWLPGGEQPEARLPALWRQTPPRQRRAALLAHVETEVASIIGIETSEVEPGQGLFDLGLDSLMAIELRDRLQAAAGARLALPAPLIFDHPSVSALADFLVDALAATAHESAGSWPAAAAGDGAAAPAGLAPDLAAPAASTGNGGVAPAGIASLPAARWAATLNVPANARPAAPAAPPAGEPIAVIGLACRFPGGADSPESFWHLLREGIDGVVPVPPERWDADAFFDADPEAPGKTYSRWGGFLRGVDQFDAAFFGISPREAASMDPQQRLLLEVAWEALERAALPADGLAHSRTGVYVGISGNDYASLPVRAAGAAGIDAYFGTGSAVSAAAGRLSYALGLQGPSLAVDTACSSSLVAVHLACQSLRAGECDLALAGGVNLILTPEAHINLARARMLASDGRCKTFDAAADGYVRGEGCGLVVLRPLAAARAAGDPVLAVIRGSAVNQDGPSAGLTAPNGQAQQAVVREALRLAGTAPASIGYVEAHGTGTALGDPIEIGALAAVLGPHGQAGGAGGEPHGRIAAADPPPLLIGSVKTNFGHLEAAAGIAGLIKTVLALHHGEIPPHLHLRQLNPRIDTGALAFAIPTAPTPWSRRPRRAGVSSFGFVGTNAHVVLEEALPAVDRAAATGEAPQGATAAPAEDLARIAHLLPLSARTPEALRDLAKRYRRMLAAPSPPALADLCGAAAHGRAQLPCRMAVVARSAGEAAERLAACLEHGGAPGLAAAPAPAGRGAPRTAFLFAGFPGGTLVSDRSGMQELLDGEPVFHRVLDRCDGLLRSHPSFGGRSLVAMLLSGPEPAGLSRRHALPALLALQLAFTELWRSWGIEPDAVAGHGTGEIAAAVAAGVFTLEDGLTLAAEHGRLAGELPPAAGGTDETDLSELEAVAATLRRGAPRLPMASGLTGRIEDEELLAAPAYWRRSSGDPGRFQAAVGALWQLGCRAFLEIGAGGGSSALPPPPPVLLEAGGRPGERLWLAATAPLAGTGERHPVAAVPGAPEENDGRTGVWPVPPAPEPRARLLESLGALWSRGATVRLEAVESPSGRARVVLPTYPFQRRRHWVEGVGPATPLLSAAGPGAHPVLGQRLRAAVRATIFERRLSAGEPALLADHRIYGGIVVPGAFHLATALAAAAEVLHAPSCTLSGVIFPEVLALEDGESRLVQITVTPEDAGGARLEVLSECGAPAGWAVHAAAALAPGDAAASGAVDAAGTPAADGADPAPPSLDELRHRLPFEDAAPLYSMMAEGGVGLGPAFRWIERLWRDGGEALAEMRLAAPGDAGDPGNAREKGGNGGAYPLPPGLVDSCFQLLGATLPAEALEAQAYIPVGVDRFVFHPPAGGRLWAHARLRPATAAGGAAFSADIRLLAQGTDDATAGRTVATMEGVHLRAAPRAALAQGERRRLRDWLYRIEWRQAPPQAPAQANGGAAAATRSPEPLASLREPGAQEERGFWLVLADRGGIGEALARRLREGGERCEIVPPLPRASAREIEALLGAAASRTRGIVHLWGLEARALGQELACGSVPPLLRAMVKAPGPPPPLWIVTRGAQGVAGGAPEPAQATLWGLGRVAAMEHPEQRIVRVDLDPAVPETHAAESLLTELGPELAAARATSAADPGAGAEDQVAWRGGVRWVPRLVRAAGPPSGHGFQARPDASYLITGGLGALGLAVAGWLAERGARHLVLLGRHAPTAAAGATLEALERRGVRALTARADVAREDELAAVLERCGRELPPLAGVVHAAGILDDGILLQQDWPRFAAVLAPKVQGAANLDRMTRHLPLDLFVLFSSAAALLGSPGQGSYAAANAYLDALAERRRAEGLAALSIAWGAWSGAGMAATGGTAARDRRSARGIASIDFDSGLATLDLLLAGPSEAAHVAVLPISWPDFLARAGRPVPFLAEVAGPRQARPPLSGPAGADSGAGRRLRETLRRAPQNQRRELLREHVRAEVADILRLAPATPIDPQQPLTELGLDSLVGLELTRALGASVGRQLPATLLYEQPTLEALTLHLEELLGREEPPATAADRAPGTAGAPATTAGTTGAPATPVATAGTPATAGRTAGTPATGTGAAGAPATTVGTTEPQAASGEIPDLPLPDVEALLERELMDVDRLLNETAR